MNIGYVLAGTLAGLVQSQEILTLEMGFGNNFLQSDSPGNGESTHPTLSLDKY
jgi:hypothetical protein